MGVKGLMQLIDDEAQGSFKLTEQKNVRFSFKNKMIWRNRAFSSRPFKLDVDCRGTLILHLTSLTLKKGAEELSLLEFYIYLGSKLQALIERGSDNTYFGRMIAIDASTQLYQFLVQVRSNGQGGGPAQLLMNEEGEITSHLQGFFTRSARLLENGIKPVFVFDGKPPTLKGGELARRREVKEKAEAELAEAERRMEEAAAGTEEHNAAVEDINKAQRRMVKVTKEQNEDAKKLLRLMGIPVVEAPCEAEAQCAELCKSGKVWATGTEDMDALAFATPILLRKLNTPESKKEPVIEIHLEKVLGPDGLNLSLEQFIDLCILCGCDYCDSIRGIGSKTALKLIREHGNIETILKNIDRTKYPVPESLETNLDQIRDLFKKPEVMPSSEIEFSFSAPKDAELLDFLVREKGFAEDRVKRVIERLHKARQGGSQMRLDNFFKPATSSSADQAFKLKQSVKSGKPGAKGGKSTKDEGGSAKKKQKS